MPRIRNALIALAATALFALPALGQNARSVEIRTEMAAEGVYVLYGQGGNIGVCIGDDGTFMIDDQYAPLTGKITEAVGKLTETPVGFLVNTHYHGDHTGGNENFGNAGAVIVAHDNVRKMMTKDHFIEAIQSDSPRAPDAALPVVTFNDEMTFHYNGQTIHIFHVEAAHTDGDSIIHFKEANVVHMGDTFFNGMYPFIDTSTGGNIDGMIKAADEVLAITNVDSKIIPGHGPLAAKKELAQYRNMLVAARDAIGALVKEGMSRDEVIAAKPTASLDGMWGGGFMQPDVWVGIVYDGMTSER